MTILSAGESILLTPVDLKGTEEVAGAERYNGGLYFPAERCVPILKRKRLEHEQERMPLDGVKAAVRLLLRESAVAVTYVNTEAMETEAVGDDTYNSFKISALLGFNDHKGGSESDYKILLQDHELGRQYVLFSPPQASDRLLDPTFHKAEFDCLSEASHGLGYKNVPNPSKTGDQALSLGRLGYEYVLFGTSETPRDFMKAFQSAGFNFSAEPYAEETLKALESNLVPSGDAWPANQFEAQISRLSLTQTY